jgi:hypothetical protein
MGKKIVFADAVDVDVQQSCSLFQQCYDYSTKLSDYTSLSSDQRIDVAIEIFRGAMEIKKAKSHFKENLFTS